MAIRNTNTQLNLEPQNIIGICKVKIEHNNKQKICNFFAVLGNGQVLLGMPDIEILNILSINCNTVGTHETDTPARCSTNTAKSQVSGCEQHYTNSKQEAGRPGRCYANTNSNSNLKPNSMDKPMVNKNEINYFLPGPNQDNEKE